MKDRIETKRLIIRRFRESDLADFNEYGSQPFVALRTGYEPHKSLEESSEILNKFISDETKWAMELKESGKVIGGFGLEIRNIGSDRSQREREIGYTMNEKYHGNGYATEATRAMLDYAFNELKLFIIRICHCDANNESRRVIEKCGFKYEGVTRYRDIWKWDGVLHHFINYSLTADEWREMRGGYQSEFCEVNYNEELNIVFVKWKKFCRGDDYRNALLYALDIMREHNGCQYVADTRNGFENDRADTEWVFDYFLAEAAKTSCKKIFFIIDRDNSLKEELEGQSVELRKKFDVHYCFDLSEIKTILGQENEEEKQWTSSNT